MPGIHRFQQPNLPEPTKKRSVEMEALFAEATEMLEETKDKITKLINASCGIFYVKFNTHNCETHLRHQTFCKRQNIIIINSVFANYQNKEQKGQLFGKYYVE
ncbi:unnamed protein product [Allacma fusca]|uniref:Uncharacterized protein n=1 Tax=Allacma fusca TaxID=39272 RepID=A0A8J2KWY2_9HEXA|nr:unnamed protein product [Allacma fusca]